jgi:hypothetical protein
LENIFVQFLVEILFTALEKMSDNFSAGLKIHKMDTRKEPKGPKKTTTGTHTAKYFQLSSSAPVSVMNWRQKNPNIVFHGLVIT